MTARMVKCVVKNRFFTTHSARTADVADDVSSLTAEGAPALYGLVLDGGLRVARGADGADRAVGRARCGDGLADLAEAALRRGEALDDGGAEVAGTEGVGDAAVGLAVTVTTMGGDLLLA
ncbi:hypothetical protein GCM10010411_75210 [Actinomadura fulvescens]|uniref:Uncharacterized protein n=1 Tax=Actinomadura fulvescens TaxID=46160 RepID=A0ABP6CXS1_9ACTN